jgi:predicted small lipoprotein YifL
MKKSLSILVAAIAVMLVVGCGQPAPLPDASASKPLPPGTKTKDVLLPIDK